MSLSWSLNILLLSVAVSAMAPMNAYAVNVTTPTYVPHAAGVPDAEIWTKEDVEVYCKNRWPQNSVSLAKCNERNKRKIGTQKSPGDLQELQTNQTK